MHTLKLQGVDSLHDTGAVSAMEIYLGNIEIWDPEAKNNAQAEKLGMSNHKDCSIPNLWEAFSLSL